jgi:TP901 family phage tail tape measure protein
MANRTVSVLLQAEIGQYVSGMTKAAAATKGLGETAETTSTRANKGFDLAGRGAQLFGLAAAGALVGIISKSMEFEKSMSGVQAATQASAGTMGELRDAAIKAGADTQYSATEAADAITEMAKAGVSTSDIMKGGLTGALNLAAAGQLDVAEAAGIASTAMTQFGLSGEQLPHVADLLAAGAGKAMGSVEDMGQALNQAGLLAASAGVSIEETTGTLAAFASAGLVGSDAGTSFKTMLQALQNPSAESSALMQQLGINAYDASGNFIGLAGLAEQLKTRLGGLTQAQRDQALAQIFGTDASRAATVLYREGAAGIEEWTRKVNDAGYAQRQAAQLTDNLSGDLERLGGSFDTLLITIGQGVQGPLRLLAQGLGGLLDVATSAIDVFSGLPGPVQAAVLAFVGWAALGNPIQDMLGKIMDKLGPVKDALSSGWDAVTSAWSAAADEGGGLADKITEVGKVGLEAAGGGLKSLAKAVGPELGMALAAATVGYLIEGFQSLASASDEAKAAAVGLADALTLTDQAADQKAVRSAIENVDGLVEILDKAGISSQVAIAGLLGESDAQDRVTAALQRYMGTLDPRRGETTAEDVRKAKQAYEELAGSYGNAAGSARYFADSASAAGGSTASASGAAAAAAPVVSDFSAKMEAVAAAASDAKRETDQFKLSLDILTGAHITLAQAESSLYAALAEATGAMDNLSGSVLNGAGQLDVQSAAGRRAQDVLFGVRDAGNEYISTLIQQGGTTEDVMAADQQLRESFIRSAGQMGISADAANTLADQILGIPSDRNTRITADVSQARGALDGVIRDYNGRTIAFMLNPNASVSVQGGLATGGLVSGPGTGTSDSIVVAVSNGEFVVNAAATRQNLALLKAINSGLTGHAVPATQGEPPIDPGGFLLPGFAAGGLIDWSDLMSHMGVRGNVDDKAARTAMHNAITKLAQAFAGGGIGPANYQSALAWARTQVGKPYIWGGVGPAGYDCSGFQSAITNVIHGKAPNSRVGATASFPWPGFAAGLGGYYSIGAFKGNPGHMAGTLLNVNVESRGGTGVVVGGSARGANAGMFNIRAHMAMANGGVIGEPVFGLGARSGNSYSFAERGPEVVLPTSREVSGRDYGGRGCAGFRGSAGHGDTAGIVVKDGGQLVVRDEEAISRAARSGTRRALAAAGLRR